MTLQELFDKAATHMLKQNAKSLLPDGANCAYRGVDGRMCAIGCLIKDEHYNANLERKSVGHKEVTQALKDSGVEESIDNFILLGKLQSVHDYFETHQWKEKLKAVAAAFSLNISACK